MVLGKLPVPGRPSYLADSRARDYCACSRCGWGLFGHFYSHLFSLLSSSLWEMARYRLKCRGGAMVLGKLPVPGHLTIWITVGQGPTALAVCAGGVVWTFLLSSILSFLCRVVRWSWVNFQCWGVLQF